MKQSSNDVDKKEESEESEEEMEKTEKDLKLIDQAFYEKELVCFATIKLLTLLTELSL